MARRIIRTDTPFGIPVRQAVERESEADPLFDVPFREIFSKQDQEAELVTVRRNIETIAADVAEGVAEEVVDTQPTTVTGVDKYPNWDTRIARWSIAQDAGLDSNGIRLSVGGTPVNINPAKDVIPFMRAYQTTAAMGSLAQISWVSLPLIRAHELEAFFVIRLVDSVDVRFWACLTNATASTMGASDNPSGHHMGFRFSTAAGDANWTAVTKDGTTQNIIDTGIAMDTSKLFVLSVDARDVTTPNVKFRMRSNDMAETLVATSTSNLPDDTTQLRLVVALTNQGAVDIKQIQTSVLYTFEKNPVL